MKAKRTSISRLNKSESTCERSVLTQPVTKRAYTNGLVTMVATPVRYLSQKVDSVAVVKTPNSHQQPLVDLQYLHSTANIISV